MTTTPNDDTDRIFTTYWMTWDDAVTLYESLEDADPAYEPLADALSLASPPGPVTTRELAHVELTFDDRDAEILDTARRHRTPLRVVRFDRVLLREV